LLDEPIRRVLASNDARIVKLFCFARKTMAFVTAQRAEYYRAARMLDGAMTRIAERPVLEPGRKVVHGRRDQGDLDIEAHLVSFESRQVKLGEL
jgi:hypothetical protein